MKVVVPIRASPHRVLPDPEAEGVRTHRWLASVADLVALEAATEHASEVVAVGIGGDRAERVAETALRAGADDAVHVEYDPVGEALGEKYATALARAVERVGADAVFLGDEAPTMDAEVVAVAADRLGWRSATAVTAMGADATEGEYDADADLVVRRRLAPGRQEVLALETPAVVGIDAGFTNPTRGSMDDVLAAQRATIDRMPLEEVVPGESRFSMSVGRRTRRTTTAYERLGRGTPPRDGTVEARIRRILGSDTVDDDGAGELVDAPPEDAARRVVEYLAEADAL